LQALRGGRLICAATFMVEVGDVRRFPKPPDGSTRSETLSMRGNPSHRNWEISSLPEGEQPSGGLGKAECRKPSVTVDEKSDVRIVPMNDLNKSDGSTPLLAEDLEGRRAAKGNSKHPPAPRTQSRTSASTRLEACALEHRESVALDSRCRIRRGCRTHPQGLWTRKLRRDPPPCSEHLANASLQNIHQQQNASRYVE